MTTPRLGLSYKGRKRLRAVLGNDPRVGDVADMCRRIDEQREMMDALTPWERAALMAGYPVHYIDVGDKR